MKVFLCVSIGLSLVSSGCFAKVYHLPPLPPHVPDTPVPQSIEEPNVFVGLAISGGGSRAATFAAGTLEALAKLQVTEGSRDVSVLEKVNYLSSVSGGSLAAAYYAARKPPKEVPFLVDTGLSKSYQDFFSQYKTDMQRNFPKAALIRQLLFFRLFNPTKFAYSLSEVWDSAFFHEITFSELYHREKQGDSPRLIINGTLYNNGRRFVLTTLSPTDFDYDLTQLLKEEMAKRGKEDEAPHAEEQAVILTGLEKARKQILPITFEDIKGDHRDLPVSMAVATSASFPPVIGPVSYGVTGEPTYSHIGDGGLFDNSGIESLASVFLKKIPPKSQKKGLIIVVDASYPFDLGNVALDRMEKGFEVFKDDPSRIVGIMEERANAYQGMLWHILRSEKNILPGFDRFRIVVLKYTDTDWTGYDDLPAECRGTFPRSVTSEEIRYAISQIPTLFKINSCHGALLIKAAHKVVEKNQDQIVSFMEVPLGNR